MVFSSVVFIFYFLPIFLACYLTLPFKHAVLLFFSLCFYAYGEVLYTYIMLVSIVLNWAFGIFLGAAAEGRSWQVVLAVGVTANLTALCYFKYLGFFSRHRGGVRTVAGVRAAAGRASAIGHLVFHLPRDFLFDRRLPAAGARGTEPYVCRRLYYNVSATRGRPDHPVP